MQAVRLLNESVVQELAALKAQLQALLPEAAALAQVPVSDFRVGAVAFDGEGRAFLGANMEFAHASLAYTVHAEQSAVMNAYINGARRIRVLAVDTPPCGHCRQFLREMKNAASLEILLPDAPALTLPDLLPRAFGPEDLGHGRALFDGVLESGAGVPENLRRLFAMSYAPYSHSPAVLEIVCHDGARFGGLYVENAAFNPSLPAVSAAFNQLYLAGRTAGDVVGGVLVCAANSAHPVQSQALWQLLSSAPLEIIKV